MNARPPAVRRPVRPGGALAVLLSVALHAGTGSAATWYVGTGGVDNGSCGTAPGTPCASVNYAINSRAAANDTVAVAAGTYSDQVWIDKNITVTGAGTATTTIQLLSAPAADATLGNTVNVVTVRNGASADISALTVSGPGPAGCGSIHTGVLVVGGASLNLHGAAVASIRDNPLSGCQNGAGVRVGWQAQSQIGTATIAGNAVSDYQKTGIVVDNAGSSASITNNTVTGVGPTPLIAQNGIQVSRGATATVSGNSVSGNECNHASCGSDPNTQTQSTGLLLYNPGAGVTLSNNTVGTSDIGLYAQFSGGGSATATGNALAGNRYEGVFVDMGTLALTGNTVSGSNYGVYVANFVGDGIGSVVNLNGGNAIQGNVTGIALYQDPGATVAPSITGSQNQIDGNATGAVNNTAGGSASLACNWWGTPLGPQNPGSPLGTGNPAAGNVTFTNWATNNANFLCNGNPQNNVALAAVSVPVADGPWLTALAALLALVAAGGLARRR